MGLGRWRQLAHRIARMEASELRLRLRQEFNKRQDHLLSGLGYDFKRHVRQLQLPPAQSPWGSFFFAPDDVPLRLKLLEARVPGQADRIVEQADKILRHRFDLLGYSDLAYGNLIDWHLDLVHGKRAPRNIFYRVRYLDFAAVGDSKVTWEINRHQHFVTLAKAYRLTGNPQYGDEIQRQWRHWWAENPYPMGINWASSLESAFRSLAWLWTYHLLEGTPGLTVSRRDWLAGLALHGRHIERYLSTYFSPNTHLLGEGVALFFLGVLCPELEAAEHWKTSGWAIVMEAARRQVRPDGFHFEQSTYYHVYALDFFLHAAILASGNGVALPAEFERALEKMLTALCLLSRAGSPPRFGDDDGGRLFDPRRNHGKHLLDPLATGAILFDRGDYKTVAGQLREETIWLLGPEGVKRWDDLAAASFARHSAALPDSGYYLFVDEDSRSQLVVDCGPQGTQSGGHGHADALSITLQSNGNALLIDPGTAEYAGQGTDRDLFRGTAMHNTLTIDGKNQAEPRTAFSWQRLTKATAEKWIRGETFDLLIASHDGYLRLPQPITHRRWLFSMRNGIYLVCDRIEGQGKHAAEIRWHLGPEMEMVEDTIFRVKHAPHGLAILSPANSGWERRIERYHWSPAYGQKEPSSVVAFSRTTEVASDFCALLVTLREVSGSLGIFAKIETEGEDSPISGYRLAGQNEEVGFFLKDKGAKNWRRGELSSDAEFVVWSRSQKPLGQRIILVNGSRVEIKNGPALGFRQNVSWGELILEENRREIYSSEAQAVEDESALLPAGTEVKGPA
jgi:Heparinase II/III-like protein/Heparinase II/III N-terminus